MIPTIQSTPFGVANPPLASVVDRGVALAPSLRPAFTAHGSAMRNLDLLFQPGTLCVTTGQQPGLCTGPSYGVHKALSAVALAGRLSRTLDQPVVPVFWVAGDDHDFAEANHFHLLNGSSGVERFVLRERAADAPTTPVYRELLGADIEAVLAGVEAIVPATEFRDDQMRWLGRHYRPDADLAGAYAGAMAELLSPFGVVVFQSTHDAAKQAMAPIILRALEAAREIDEALGVRVAELERSGQAVQVPVRAGNTMVMLECEAGRDRLVMDSDGFKTRRGGRHYSLRELETLASTHPDKLSPNVLLRPVVEASLLPTVAYVAGPGEQAYFTEVDPVATVLGVRRQAVVSRWSGRVVEAKVGKIMDKYGITPDDLTLAEGQLEGRLVADSMPADATTAMAALRAAIEEQYQRILDAGTGVDPTLKKPILSAQGNALKGIADVEKRIVSHLKQNQDTLVRQIATARNALFPLHKPQERVLNVMQYLVRYGNVFLEGILAACDTWAAELE